MTVFGLAHAARERRGSGSVTRTTFRVTGRDTLAYWAARFDALGVAHGAVAMRDGRAVLDFDDVEGTRLALVDDGEGLGASPWPDRPVPARRQLRGLGNATITVPALHATDGFLTTALGLRDDHSYPLAETPEHEVHVYATGGGGTEAEVHVVIRNDLPSARYGAGGVHHVALRVAKRGSMADWVAHLDAHGYPNSGIVDRHYFTSIYVREPNGVLFELATDGPGLAVDGPLDPERLTLPPSLEPRSAEIEARLLPLNRLRA
jgi:glyoxalase family protein